MLLFPFLTYPVGDCAQSNNLRFFECCKCAVFLDCFKPLHRDIEDDGLADFCDIDTAFLDIRLSADLAGRVELGRAGTIRIPPADLRALSGYCAGACHSCPMVAYDTIDAI